MHTHIGVIQEDASLAFTRPTKPQVKASRRIWRGECVMTTVAFTHNKLEGNYTVGFQFDQRLVNLIKAVVPGYARSWSAPTKRWLVSDSYADALAKAMTNLGYTVVGIRTESAKARTAADAPRADQSQWARTLFHRVGPTRVVPVYRALSRIVHPDTATGDTKLQQELNDAYGELAPKGAHQ